MNVQFAGDILAPLIDATTGRFELIAPVPLLMAF